MRAFTGWEPLSYAWGLPHAFCCTGQCKSSAACAHGGCCLPLTCLLVIPANLLLRAQGICKLLPVCTERWCLRNTSTAGEDHSAFCCVAGGVASAAHQTRQSLRSAFICQSTAMQSAQQARTWPCWHSRMRRTENATHMVGKVADVMNAAECYRTCSSQLAAATQGGASGPAPAAAAAAMQPSQ